MVLSSIITKITRTIHRRVSKPIKMKQLENLCRQESVDSVW
jgi:hypothetical protein